MATEAKISETATQVVPSSSPNFAISLANTLVSTKASKQAARNAPCDQLSRPGHHQADDLVALCTQRGADSDLLGALADL
jgi:hypothetical protein